MGKRKKEPKEKTIYAVYVGGYIEAEEVGYTREGRGIRFVDEEYGVMEADWPNHLLRLEREDAEALAQKLKEEEPLVRPFPLKKLVPDSMVTRRFERF